VANRIMLRPVLTFNPGQLHSPCMKTRRPSYTSATCMSICLKFLVRLSVPILKPSGVCQCNRRTASLNWDVETPRGRADQAIVVPRQPQRSHNCRGTPCSGFGAYYTTDGYVGGVTSSRREAYHGYLSSTSSEVSKIPCHVPAIFVDRFVRKGTDTGTGTGTGIGTGTVEGNWRTYHWKQGYIRALEGHSCRMCPFFHPS